MSTITRAPRQVVFPGEVGQLAGRTVHQPPWAQWRRMAWTWERNPNFDRGQWAKKRWRLETQVVGWYRRVNRDIMALVQAGRRLPWVTQHRVTTGLKGLEPGRDFGYWLGPDPWASRTRLYLRDQDISQARRFCALMVDISVEIRRLLHPLPHALPQPTTGGTDREEERRREEAFVAKKRAALDRYRAYLASQASGSSPPPHR